MAHAQLIFGTVQLGQPYGAANVTGMPDDEAATHLIHRALDLGVSSFDTARAYGLAEERLGAALESSAAKLAHVITKLSPVSNEAVANIQASLLALRSPTIETLLLHRADQMDNADIWDGLCARHNEGVVGRLGASVQIPQELIRALRNPNIEHIQMPGNILDWRWRSDEVRTALARRPDVIIHVRSAFLQGLLAAGLQAHWPEVDGVDPEQIVSALAHLTHEFGRQSAADLCLAYLRAQDWIDGIVVGMETEAQLVGNVGLFAKTPLSPGQCAIAEDMLPRLPEQFLNPALWPPAETR